MRFPSTWILTLLLSSTPAFAISGFQPPFQDNEIRLGLQGNSYLTKNRETLADERTGNVGLSIGGRANGASGMWRGTFEGEGLVGLRKSNYRYLDIAELNGGIDTKVFGVYVGRKKYEWNALDSYWPLGLYQPRFRWDYLNEREDGLFGAFLDFHPSEQLHFVAYGSPIFLPETGAPFDISGGECKTASPWFACPSSSVLLFNQATNVRFRLEIPPIRKLINQAGGGATLRVGNAERAHFRFSYAYKPLNSFLLAYEGQLDLSTLTLPAVIHPRPTYHHLYSFDAGFKVGEARFVASTIWEKPVRDYTPPNWNTQEIGDATIAGGTFKMPVLQASRVELSYLHRKGGNAPDRGPFAAAGQGVFEPRYAFRNAYSATLVTSFFPEWMKTFTWSTRFVYDGANDGNILISDLHYRLFQRAVLNLGIDILGSENRDPVDFISRYQRNDRVRGSFTYAF